MEPIGDESSSARTILGLWRDPAYMQTLILDDLLLHGPVEDKHACKPATKLSERMGVPFNLLTTPLRALMNAGKVVVSFRGERPTGIALAAPSPAPQILRPHGPRTAWEQQLYVVLDSFRFEDPDGSARRMLYFAAGVTDQHQAKLALNSLCQRGLVSMETRGGGVRAIRRTDRPDAPVWEPVAHGYQRSRPMPTRIEPAMRTPARLELMKSPAPELIAPLQQAAPAPRADKKVPAKGRSGGASKPMLRAKALAAILATCPDWRWNHPSPAEINRALPAELRFGTQASASAGLSVLLTDMQQRGWINQAFEKKRLWIELTPEGAAEYGIS